MIGQDLLLNLLSEALGILVTVFLVDKLIKQREEARWTMLRKVGYQKLMSATGQFLILMIPVPSNLYASNPSAPLKLLVESHIKHFNPPIYSFKQLYYGLLHVPAYVEDSSLFEMIRNETLRATIEQAAHQEQELVGKAVRDLTKKILDAIEKSWFVNDPEFLGSLAELQNFLEDIWVSRDEEKIVVDKMNLGKLYIVVMKVLSLRTILINRADKIISSVEVLQGATQGLEYFYGKKQN